MLLPPRERRPVVPFELEFLGYFKPYVMKSRADAAKEEKAKKAKAKAKAKAAKASAAAAKKAAPKAKPAGKKAPAAKKAKGAAKPAAKKTAAKKLTALVKKPSATTTMDTSAMAFNDRVAAARQAATGLTRQQSATAAKLAEKGSLTHKWQYLDDNGRWSDYAPAASVEVEKMYANWMVNPHIDVRCVKSGDWEYMVDFNAMQQQNIKHQNHRIRKVNRVPVAGAGSH